METPEPDEPFDQWRLQQLIEDRKYLIGRAWLFAALCVILTTVTICIFPISWAWATPPLIVAIGLAACAFDNVFEAERLKQRIQEFNPHD